MPRNFPALVLPIVIAAANSALTVQTVAAQANGATTPATSSDTGQAVNLRYSEEIHKHTTDECFSTPYVTHLPASDVVPTPLDVLGHIAGAPDVLSYSHEVHDYMRAVAAASPRVQVFPAGRSEEGREIILVVAGSESAIANLERYKRINNQLADPRALPESEAQRLIQAARPMYWATGAMHSPETGSPEMLMELVYRLAVEETPLVREIRDNLIFMTTPVLEVDGRDKRVDLLQLSKDESARAPRLLYWGKYVAHDNNRDAIGMGLKLSDHLMSTFLEYKPQVLHDLHESAPHLYTSTGTGPYNAWLDPILIDEWHILAYQEVTELTKLGVPGVWTHDFYDGWAPHYAFYAANGHNAIGRFYETQGAGSADTRRITTRRSSRAWYRPNPPLPSTMWSIRNNVNLQQSGLLIAMNYMAKHRRKFMENFYLKSKRSIEKPGNEGPAAYVFPADDRRPRQQADLLNLLLRQGCEVHRTVRVAKIEQIEIPARSYVVRMDQPYSRMADMLLDRGYYNVDDPRPYDDTGWTLGPLFNTSVERVEDVSILDVTMQKVKGRVLVPGRIEALTEGEPVAYLVDHDAESALATFRFACSGKKTRATEKAFDLGGLSFQPGTLVVSVEENEAGLDDDLASAAADFGFVAYATNRFPGVPTHGVSVPRVAVMHTWVTTQNEGWLRMALDAARIPYDYISVHEVRDDPHLRDKFDVIVFGPSSSDALSIVRGLPKTGKPIPWKSTDSAPNIGRQDETDDMRGGLELEGVLHLRDFLHAGGTLITIQNSCSLPTHFGLAEGVSIAETEDLRCSGSVLRAEIADRESPIVYGYDDEVGVYFRRAPVLRIGGRSRRFPGFGQSGASTLPKAERILAGSARPTGRGTVEDPDRVPGRPRDLGKSSKETSDGGARGSRASRGPRPRSRARTILRFAKEHEELLISGMLAGGDELAGTPAVVDAPVGKGHIVLFAINPTWRHITQGSWSLVFNTILHFDHLSPRLKETL